MDENRNEVGGGQLIAGYLGIILMLIGGITVSYTHLTLPTNREV